MKTEILLQRNPNRKFADVARSIAKGDPPKWLILGLTQFSGGIGSKVSDEDRRLFETQIKRMHGGADTLIKWLPIWGNLPYGIQYPEDVAVVLDALPRIKKDLDRLGRKQIGRTPDTQREICAAVVLEAWKIIHSRPEPRSRHLLEACRDYWRACGGEQIGDWDEPENWRRTVKRALETDHSWINLVLLAAQNEH
jgi:hypothetical protein